MSSPRVSVVVPTFNRAYCLERTLRSALAQTHRNVDVIVVDDGSTDGTAALLQRMREEDPRLRVFTQENQGVVAARNTALRQADGDYVAFLDSDDLWFPWKLELQVACFQKEPALGMVWSDMKAVDAAGATVDSAYLRTFYSAYRRFSMKQLFDRSSELPSVASPHDRDTVGRTLYVGDIYSAMLFGSLVHTSTVMLSRERLERVGLFDMAMGRSGEDYDFHLRTCREGLVGLIDVPTIAYQTGMGDQLTRPQFAVLVAEGYLKAVTKAITRDRSRINLPADTISAIVANAHIWLGEELLEAQRRTEARMNFGQAFRERPGPRPLLRWVRACIPDALANPLRQAYRAARILPS